MGGGRPWARRNYRQNVRLIRSSPAGGNVPVSGGNVSRSNRWKTLLLLLVFFFFWRVRGRRVIVFVYGSHIVLRARINLRGIN